MALGCDDSGKKGAKPAKQADAKGKADAKAKPDAKAEPPADKGNPHIDLADAEREKLKKQAREVKEHLTLARSKAKIEDWPAAVESYAKAAKIDDDNPKILGEYGWALFNTKDLDGAQHYIRLALRYEHNLELRSEHLYQLGRIEEEKGDYVSAKDHYDHSLALKERAEAREHDEAVGSKAKAACKGGKCDKPDYKDLDEACAALVARVHEQQGLDPHAADNEFKCDPAAAKKIKLEGGDATEAVLLTVKGEYAGTEEEEHDLLAHIEGGWHWVGTLLDLENPHHGGIARKGKVLAFEGKELIPDATGTEILVQVEMALADVDLDENLVYYEEHEAYVVCSIQKNSHACHEIPTKLTYEAEALDPEQEVAHDVEPHMFDATAEFDGKGNVTVKGTGEVPEAEKGTHKITDLPEPDGFVFLHDE